MTEEFPGDAVAAFEAHEDFEPDGEGFAVTTTVFDARVTATAADDGPGHRFRVTVRPPTLQAATADAVGEAVREGWFDTLERRLAGAPAAVRRDLDLSALECRRDGDEVVVAFVFESAESTRAAEVAAALVTYTEGTYLEGVIPGYDYEPPVADLLADASTDDRGPPL